jgi:hypothetical protein
MLPDHRTDMVMRLRFSELPARVDPILADTAAYAAACAQVRRAYPGGI